MVGILLARTLPQLHQSNDSQMTSCDQLRPYDSPEDEALRVQGSPTCEATEIKRIRVGNAELCRTNETCKAASASFAPEPVRSPKR